MIAVSLGEVPTAIERVLTANETGKSSYPDYQAWEASIRSLMCRRTSGDQNPTLQAEADRTPAATEPQTLADFPQGPIWSRVYPSG